MTDYHFCGHCSFCYALRTEFLKQIALKCETQAEILAYLTLHVGKPFIVTSRINAIFSFNLSTKQIKELLAKKVWNKSQAGVISEVSGIPFDNICRAFEVKS